MRDDDSFDDAPRRNITAGRSDDVPSSDPTATSPDLGGPLGFGARSRRRLDGLWALRSTAQAQIADLLGRRDYRRTVLAGVVCCLGLASFAQVRTELTDRAAVEAATDRPGIVQRVGEQPASRSTDWAIESGPTPSTGAPQSPAASASQQPDPDTSAAPSQPAAPAKIEERVDPGPVAGLSVAQMDNAKAIVRTGRDMGVPRRGLIIAVATAMQESQLLNLASGALPESMNHPNQGVGWDHDSVGLFQQRSSSGWGPVKRLMDPAFATARFLSALEQVPGWQQMALTDAAQAVQVSAFPYAYAQHESRATAVVDAIVPGWS